MSTRNLVLLSKSTFVLGLPRRQIPRPKLREKVILLSPALRLYGEKLHILHVDVSVFSENLGIVNIL